MDKSDVHAENAESPIRDSFEPDSNITIESVQQPEKHFKPTTSTEAGMTMDESDRHSKKAKSPIRDTFEPDSNVTLETRLRCAKHAE
jgi:hypothetical protein